MVKNLPAMQETQVSISRSGRFPEEGNGYPFQCFCLENSTDRGTWWAEVHGVTRSQTQLSNTATHTHTHTQTQATKLGLYSYKMKTARVQQYKKCCCDHKVSHLGKQIRQGHDFLSFFHLNLMLEKHLFVLLFFLLLYFLLFIFFIVVDHQYLKKSINIFNVHNIPSNQVTCNFYYLQLYLHKKMYNPIEKNICVSCKYSVNS